VHICNVVRIVFVSCELGDSTRWFNTVLISSIPTIVGVSGGTAYVGFSIFWAPFYTSNVIIAFDHSLLFFPLSFFVIVFCFRFPHQHSYRSNQQEMVYQLSFVRFLCHHLPWLFWSGWECHFRCPPYQVMSPLSIFTVFPSIFASPKFAKRLTWVFEFCFNQNSWNHL
jgi:hypothetical protein